MLSSSRELPMSIVHRHNTRRDPDDSQFVDTPASRCPPAAGAQAAGAAPEATPPEDLTGVGSTRRLFLVAILAAVLGFVITLSFGYADHDPVPHGLRVAVVAPAPIRAGLAAGLDRAEPGGFTLLRSSSARAATRKVRSESVVGALVVPTEGTNTLVTAGAEGVLQKQVLTTALTAASRAMHRSVTPVDVAPLPRNDRSGLASFVFGLGLLIPSVIGSVGLFLLGMRRRLWWRVAAATLFALLAAGAGVVALGSILGAFPTISLTLGAVGFLGALSFVLFAAALQAVVGLPGTVLAAIGFIFVGNAVSGGSVPIAFLPGGFRQIAPWLPNSAIVAGTRDVLYFNAHHLGHPFLVLSLWPGTALAILALVDLLHRAERRRRLHPTHEIYRTAALVHLARRLHRKGAQSSQAPTHGATAPGDVISKA
jgi:hypothetical protein